MPNLWKFLSKADADAPKVELYQFTEAEELKLFSEEEPEPWPEEPDEAADAAEAEREPNQSPEPSDPVSYARIQSDLLLQDARQQAEEILRQAEEQAAQRMEEAMAQAREAGYQAGFQEGIQKGTAEALEAGVRAREALAQRLEGDVEAFIRKAEGALNLQMDENLEALRDLALAVAEKIVCVSLKSSREVIGRMIQTAVDKRKRREWAHIYIAECDAKRLTTLPPALAAALSELSDRVRIIPMADDEAGTCIIECPDEIIDASAATQMQNIRDLLSNRAVSGMVTSFNFTERGTSNRVPTDDSSGL